MEEYFSIHEDIWDFNTNNSLRLLVKQENRSNMCGRDQHYIRL